MKGIKISLLTALLLAISGFLAISAQSRLERVSFTERADGLGYVMRFHLTEMAEIYRASQPETDLIQMIIYSSELAGEELTISELPDAIETVEYFTVENGLAFDISVSEDAYFRVFSYPDVNRRDVLLAFEYTDRESALRAAQVHEKMIWQEPVAEVPEIEEQEPEQEEQAEPVVMENVDQPDERAGWEVGIGLRAGFSFSNKYGAGYGRDTRNGYTVATTFDIQMPYRLPYNIRPGIETGIAFSQKGFENPAAQKLDAETVEFDYVEIPVLAKFSYDWLPLISPHIVFGPYAAFMINAEQVGADGSRSDLDDVTGKTDVGIIAGLGFDLHLGNVVFNTQLRGSLGLTPIFRDEEFNDGEKHGLFSVVFGFGF